MVNNDLSKILLSNNIIGEQELHDLNGIYQNNVFDIFLHLIQEGIIEREELGRLIGDSLNITYVTLKKIKFQPDVVVKLPEDFARTHKIIPMYKFGNVITVVAADPRNSIMIDNVEKLVECRVNPLFSFPDEIDEAIESNYILNNSLQGLIKDFFVSPSNTEKPDKNNPVKEEEQKCLIPEPTQKFLTENTKQIHDEAKKGKIPDPANCKNVRNVIIEEVNNKLDLVYCINQLRIKDEYTYSHSVNVAMLSSAVGKVLGYSPTLIKELTLGALLHDIGKVRIPKTILNKPGSLTPQELEIVKKHPFLGYQIACMMKLPAKITEIIYNHHERINGNGYPRGLRVEKLSLNAQIVAVVDVYDAMISERPYKKAVSHHEALNVMLLEGNDSLNYDILYKFTSLVYKTDFDSLKKSFLSVVQGEI